MTAGRTIALVVFGYPLAELVVAILVASIIGWYAVFVIFILGIVVGLVIAKLGAQATGRSWRASVDALRPPTSAPAITSGAPVSRSGPAVPARTALLVPAGLLIAVPGFLTDIAGLVLLLPPVRARIAGRIEAAMRRATSPPMTPPGYGGTGFES